MGAHAGWAPASEPAWLPACLGACLWLRVCSSGLSPHHLECPAYDPRQHVAVAEGPVLLWQLNKVGQGVVRHHLGAVQTDRQAAGQYRRVRQALPHHARGREPRGRPCAAVSLRHDADRLACAAVRAGVASAKRRGCPCSACVAASGQGPPEDPLHCKGPLAAAAALLFSPAPHQAALVAVCVPVCDVGADVEEHGQRLARDCLCRLPEGAAAALLALGQELIHQPDADVVAPACTGSSSSSSSPRRTRAAGSEELVAIISIASRPGRLLEQRRTSKDVPECALPAHRLQEVVLQSATAVVCMVQRCLQLVCQGVKGLHTAMHSHTACVSAACAVLGDSHFFQLLVDLIKVLKV